MKVKNAIKRSRANSEYYTMKSKSGQNLSFTNPTKRDTLLIHNNQEVNMNIIKTELNNEGTPVNKALVEHNGKFYIVSESNRFGLETLIFPSDSEGKITEYVEVGGGRGVALHEVLANFENELF